MERSKVQKIPEADRVTQAFDILGALGENRGVWFTLHAKDLESIGHLWGLSLRPSDAVAVAKILQESRPKTRDGSLIDARLRDGAIEIALVEG